MLYSPCNPTCPILSDHPQMSFQGQKEKMGSIFPEGCLFKKRYTSCEKDKPCSSLLPKMKLAGPFQGFRCDGEILRNLSSCDSSCSCHTNDTPRLGSTNGKKP